MKTIEVYIKEMSCNNCSNTIIKQLEKHKINDIEINLMDKTILINFDDTKINEDELLKLINKIGFTTKVI